MPQIVGVKFKYTGKIYYFNPGELNLKVGQLVLAKTSRGIEIGKIVLSNRNLFDDKISMDLKDIIRVATQKDIEEKINIDLEAYNKECEDLKRLLNTMRVANYSSL